MAVAQRIRGQETSVLIVRDGALEAELTDIQSCNVEFQFETKAENYLGEGTSRKDDIFNGIKGSIQMHLHSTSYSDFIDAVRSRAQRTTPDTTINISTVQNFADGSVLVYLFQDCKFGSMPLDTANRSDYVSLKLDFECNNYTKEAR